MFMAILSRYVSAHHFYAVPVGVMKRASDLLKLKFPIVLSCHVALEIEPRLSGRAAYAPNCWVILPDLLNIIYIAKCAH